MVLVFFFESLGPGLVTLGKNIAQDKKWKLTKMKV